MLPVEICANAAGARPATSANASANATSFAANLMTHELLFRRLTIARHGRPSWPARTRAVFRLSGGRLRWPFPRRIGAGLAPWSPAIPGEAGEARAASLPFRRLSRRSGTGLNEEVRQRRRSPD